MQRPDSMAPHGREPFPSDVLLAAIDHGLAVTGIAVPEARALDIGTPETLSRVLARGGTLA